MSDRLAEIDEMSGCARVVEMLAQPAAYAERPVRVECVETHISLVFLTDRFAYKLKKPVRFDFLDFSTVALRHAACKEEIRLNRRLAPHVYLDVVPITSDHGRLRLGGTGPPVDWVVKMRRLPAERTVDRLIRSGELTDGQVHQIGLLLTDFYQQLPPVALRTDEYRREIEAHVLGNRDELMNTRHGLDANVARRVHEAQLRFLRLCPELLDDRVCDGRIVDGHGDLRPEHIYLAPQPTVIDCLEFNAELRQLDVADELSFLAMECAALDAERVGDAIIKHYRERSGDQPGAELLSFYKCYRACVRAKVWALRAEQLDGDARQTALESAARYLRLADRYRAQLGSPLMLVVRGLTGTGKSTLAAAVAGSLGIELLQTDAIRRELFGPSASPADYDAAIYEPQNRARVYDEMFRRAESLLAAGFSVVLDGTFLAADARSRAVALADRYRACPLLVRCHCPDELAAERIESRLATGRSISESRPNILARQKQADEPDPPGLRSVAVDTAQAVPEIIAAVFGELCRRLFPGLCVE
jgi:aminoglycoside phosphotransferase family enzyme/predicted kinase